MTISISTIKRLWRRFWRWVTGIEGAERALVQRHIDYFENGED